MLALAFFVTAMQDGTRAEALAEYYDAAADYTTALIEIEAMPTSSDKAALEKEGMVKAMHGFQARAAKCGTSFLLPDGFSGEPRLQIHPKANPESVKCLKHNVPFATFEAK
ncbi:MAG: hypothetical protein V4808_10195 [Pseudomonadota bacterium]